MKTKKNTSFLRGIREEFIFFGVLLIGIVLGTYYAFSVKQDTTFLYIFDQYIGLEYLRASTIERIQYSLFTYGKKIFIFLGCMLLPLNVPLYLMILFSVCFSYGFTVTCFVLLYGVKGVFIAILSIGLQSLTIILLFFYLHNKMRLVSKSHHKSQIIKEYGGEILKMGIILFLLVSIDSIVQPIFQKIIFFMR
jgi:hypothetical protein